MNSAPWRVRSFGTRTIILQSPVLSCSSRGHEFKVDCGLRRVGPDERAPLSQGQRDCGHPELDCERGALCEGPGRAPAAHCGRGRLLRAHHLPSLERVSSHPRCPYLRLQCCIVAQSGSKRRTRCTSEPYWAKDGPSSINMAVWASSNAAKKPRPAFLVPRRATMQFFSVTCLTELQLVAVAMLSSHLPCQA